MHVFGMIEREMITLIVHVVMLKIPCLLTDACHDVPVYIYDMLTYFSMKFLGIILVQEEMMNMRLENENSKKL